MTLDKALARLGRRVYELREFRAAHSVALSVEASVGVAVVVAVGVSVVVALGVLVEVGVLVGVGVAGATCVVASLTVLEFSMFPA